MRTSAIRLCPIAVPAKNLEVRGKSLLDNFLVGLKPGARLPDVLAPSPKHMVNGEEDFVGLPAAGTLRSVRLKDFVAQSMPSMHVIALCCIYGYKMCGPLSMGDL